MANSILEPLKRPDFNLKLVKGLMLLKNHTERERDRDSKLGSVFF